MAWIELHQALFTHRKTMAAADALDISEVYVVGHLAALWTWALDNAADGHINASARIVARACQWTGEPDALIAALTNAGFLEMHPAGGFAIHDWGSYGGKLADQRESNRRRQQEFRDRRRSSERDVTVTSPSHSALENSTGENTIPPCSPPKGAGAVAPAARVDASPPLADRTDRTRSRPARGERIPEGWQPTKEAVACFREAHPELRAVLTEAFLRTETERFRDHFLASAQPSARKLDWLAAWRNWTLRAANDTMAAHPSAPPDNAARSPYAPFPS